MMENYFRRVVFGPEALLMQIKETNPLVLQKTTWVREQNLLAILAEVSSYNLNYRPIRGKEFVFDIEESSVPEDEDNGDANENNDGDDNAGDSADIENAEESAEDSSESSDSSSGSSTGSSSSSDKSSSSSYASSDNKSEDEENSGSVTSNTDQSPNTAAFNGTLLRPPAGPCPFTRASAFSSKKSPDKKHTPGSTLDTDEHFPETVVNLSASLVAYVKQHDKDLETARRDFNWTEESFFSHINSDETQHNIFFKRSPHCFPTSQKNSL